MAVTSDYVNPQRLSFLEDEDEPTYGEVVEELSIGNDHTNVCSPAPTSTTYLTRQRPFSLLAQHNAKLVIEALCGVPEQMARRATFPSFIHPHWHAAELPEALAVCMRIAQMFASRTPEVMPFIWRTILAEQKRVLEMVRSERAVRGLRCLTDET